MILCLYFLDNGPEFVLFFFVYIIVCDYLKLSVYYASQIVFY